ncbi:uncharacterized protein [Epargyreus clarus]|uniref:uncharacterized protein n=1 Tax=Epargyreus clarus TaxID=520877 RepID=UPI003C303444
MILQSYSRSLTESCWINMVSIVLLTTEEVLQRNGFWKRLDTLWITQEMEPFEEVKPEHVYSKPLSRDFYYSKFPDIPRSESEDENSLTVSGFKNKHQEWKSKIGIRKFVLRKRHSSQSNYSIKSCNSTASLTDVTNKILTLSQKSDDKNETMPKNNDERVRAFLNRLIENIPPPPIEDLHDSISSIMKPQFKEDLSDIDLPDYADFERDKIIQHSDEQSLIPATSTLKRSKRRVSFSLNSLKSDLDKDSWYETIYGVSDLVSKSKDEISESCNSLQKVTSDSDCYISWSDVVNMCGISDSILKSRESLENIVSRSHGVETDIADLTQQDEEAQYTTFAVRKIHQTLKIKRGIADTSSMNDFNCENDENQLKINALESDPIFYRTIYRLAPQDDDELVNVAQM